MPYIAARADGEKILPAQYNEDDDLHCPECKRDMHYVEGQRLDNPEDRPYFMHTASGYETDCSGESDTHLLMKDVVSWRLRNLFRKDQIKMEHGIGNKRADVTAIFDTPRQPWGDGLAIECQWKNEDKDIQQTTEVYLRNGFSILWLDQDDFDSLDEERGASVAWESDEIVAVWPHAITYCKIDNGFFENHTDTSSFGGRAQVPAAFYPSWYRTFEATERESVYTLSEYNAPRTCDVCSEQASVYVHEHGFSCDGCVP